MHSFSDRGNWAAIAASVAGLGTLVYYLTQNNMEKGNELLPALELKETQAILAKILESLKILAVKYSRATQHIQSQIAQQGQQVSEDDVKKHYILPHFETGFQEAEDEILAQYDCDSDELEEAGRYYALKEKDATVIEILNKIKRLHKEFGGVSDMNEFTDGNGVVETPMSVSSEPLTLEKVIEILTQLSHMVGEATDAYCTNFIANSGVPKSPDLLQKFQVGMLEMSETMEANVLKANGLTQMEFQSGIMAHQNDPTLHQVIQAMQVNNQQRLLQHGIAMQ